MRSVKKLHTALALLAMSGALLLLLTGCHRSSVDSGNEPQKILAMLDGKRVTVGLNTGGIDRSNMFNAIDQPEELVFGKDKVHIKSVGETTVDAKRNGATFYYLTLTKADLLKYLPKDDRLNDNQPSIHTAHENSVLNKHYIKSIKEDNVQNYIVIAPHKYKNIQEFEKEAPENSQFSTHNNWAIWEVYKKGHTVFLTDTLAKADLKEKAHKSHTKWQNKLVKVQTKINIADN